MRSSQPATVTSNFVAIIIINLEGRMIDSLVGQLSGDNIPKADSSRTDSLIASRIIVDLAPMC